MAFHFYEDGFIPDLTREAPLVLTVPGLNNSGPAHWQTRWEQSRADCRRVDLGDWARPWRGDWIRRLDLAIVHAARPVVLAAHSLGCLAVAWWAAQAHRDDLALVRGALLVAPPDADFFPLDDRLETFSPTPLSAFPFPSVVVASEDDPWMGIHAARRIAKAWGSDFVSAGRAGHINADSGLGEWPAGQAVLDALLIGTPVPLSAAPARQTAAVHR